VTEATRHNVVCDFGAGLVTPPVSSGLLPGTFRAYLIESGEVREEVVRVSGLPRAKRLFVVNSVVGWREARLRDGRRFVKKATAGKRVTRAPRTTRLAHTERRVEILRAAAACFHRRGYHGASVEEIAKALQMTKGNLYYYFKDKEEILFFCHDYSLDLLLDLLRRVRGRRRNPRSG
jgi:hypothetical protein